MSVFDDLQAMEHEMEALTRSMSDLDHTARVCQRRRPLPALEHEFRTRDGYALEAAGRTGAHRFRFHREDWTRQTEEFSGGWQMRIALAKLLLQKPNLLLLDEPTNHLDLEARNWLEEYLTSYPYAFVLISHDRYFLDVTVDRIVEIWNKRLHFYTGNYDNIWPQKDARKEQLEAAYETSATASSNWKSSSTAFATRPPRPSRCRAASRNWRRSSASKSLKKKRRSTSPSRSPSPAAASSPSSRT